MADTDDAAPEVVLTELARCAAHWQGDVRVMGDVRAKDIVRAIAALLSALPKGEPAAWQLKCNISGEVRHTTDAKIAKLLSDEGEWTSTPLFAAPSAGDERR